MKRTSAILAIGLTLAPSFGAAAQDEPYPSRPVRLIAAAGPGGNPDVLARLLADRTVLRTRQGLHR